MILDPFTLVLAALTAIVSVARLARLFTQDVYPPVARLRVWWEDLVYRSRAHDDWAKLATCPYCAAIYLSAVIMGWAALSVWLTGDIHWTWWLFNGTLAVAYLAAVFVVRDGE